MCCLPVLQTAAPCTHIPQRPPHLLPQPSWGGEPGVGGTETLGCWGCWIPASVHLPKKTGWAVGRVRGGHTDGGYPALPHTTPCSWGAVSAPSWWRDCPAEASLQRARAAASGQGSREHLAQAFYTLQCNFFILFYSDYDYSGILSQISLGLAF